MFSICTKIRRDLMSHIRCDFCDCYLEDMRFGLRKMELNQKPNFKFLRFWF